MVWSVVWEGTQTNKQATSKQTTSSNVLRPAQGSPCAQGVHCEEGRGPSRPCVCHEVYGDRLEGEGGVPLAQRRRKVAVLGVSERRQFRGGGSARVV